MQVQSDMDPAATSELIYKRREGSEGEGDGAEGRGEKGRRRGEQLLDKVKGDKRMQLALWRRRGSRTQRHSSLQS